MSHSLLQLSTDGKHVSAVYERDLLPDSSDEEDNKKLTFSEEEGDVEFYDDDSDDDFNQSDFDVRTGAQKVAMQREKRAEIVLDQDWPPSTSSASIGIFAVTPKEHARLDPRFASFGARRHSLDGKANDEKRAKFAAGKGGFEECYNGEPAHFKQLRAEAFTMAWDLCLERCTRIVAAHFKLSITELCRFVRQKHDAWSWSLNVIPCATVVLGVDTSDHPVFFGSLKRQLQRGRRRVAFLNPATCTTMSKTLDSFVKQVVPHENRTFDSSLASIQRFVENIRSEAQTVFSGFSLTIIIQNVEHWANTNILNDFLELVSHYAAHWELTIVLAVSSSRESVQTALSPLAMQLLSSKTFYITSSTTAIDLILRSTILAADAPFQPSAKFLKWILENVKFLNHSISALVTKLKFIYWRFFYTQPLSWISVDDGLRQLEWIAKRAPIDTLLQPFSRLVASYFTHIPMQEDTMRHHEYVTMLKYLEEASLREKEIFGEDGERRENAKKTGRKSSSNVSGDKDEEECQNAVNVLKEALTKWTKSFQRACLLRAVVLDMFMALKHFSLLSTGVEVLSEKLPTKMDAETQLLQVQGVREMAELNKKRLGTNLGSKNGIYDETTEEDHTWYGCPHAYEYYALMTNARAVVHSALNQVRGDVRKLNNVLVHWLSIIARLASSRESTHLHNVLSSIFEPELQWIQKHISCLNSVRKKKNALSPDELEMLSSHLLEKMQDVLLSAFSSQMAVKTPISFALTISDEDTAQLNRRFNPNIRPSQANGITTLLTDLEPPKTQTNRKKN